MNEVNRGALRGLDLFFWGYVGKEGFSLLIQLLFYLMPHVISPDLDGEGWTMVDWYQFVATINLGVQILGMAICCAGLWVLTGGGQAKLVILSLVGFGISLGLTAAWIFLRWAWDAGPTHVWLTETLWTITPLAETVGLVLLVVFLGRAARSAGRDLSGMPIPIYAAAGLLFVVSKSGMILRHVMSDSGSYSEYAWLHGVINIGSGVLNLILLVLVIVFVLDSKRVLSGRAVPALDKDGGPQSSLGEAPWPTVRRGVATYRAGLIAKIWVVALGFGFLLLAALGRSQEVARGVLVLMAVGGGICSGWMLFGLFGYAQVPVESGGKGPASVSLVMAGLAVLLELYSIVLVFQMMSDSYSTIRAAVDIAPWVEGCAQAVGLLGAMSLLFSFSRVGRHVGAPQVSRRVGVVAVMLGSTAVGALSMKALIVTRTLRGLGVVPLALGLLILAIVTLVMFLGVLKQLRRALGAFGDARVFD